ncbi:unnamed protein product, partial [Laminaria digitata]
EEDYQQDALSSARQEDALGDDPVAPRVQSSDSATAVVEATTTDRRILPDDVRRGAAVVTAQLAKVVTALRRAKLWMLLRRKSRVRAEPLLPGVETGISTLAEQLKSAELLPSSVGVPSVGEGETPPLRLEDAADGVEDIGAAAAAAAAAAVVESESG